MHASVAKINQLLIDLGIPQLRETIPDTDRNFMEYCNLIRSCADHRINAGLKLGLELNCGNCIVSGICRKEFDRACTLSSEGKFTRVKTTEWSNNFLELCGRHVFDHYSRNHRLR